MPMPAPGLAEVDNTMRLTGAQAICQSLVQENVPVVFGIPGGGVIHLYHALPEFTIRHVLMRHEQAVIHAADGYARGTGRVGVCIATSGPGATNLLTGLMTALRDASPVVALTGQSASSVIGTEAFQEVDITGITLPISKHNYLVTSTHDLPAVMKEAFHIARTGRPGPVVVTIATDVQSAKMDFAYPASADLPGYRVSEGDTRRPHLPGASFHQLDPDDPGSHDAATRDAAAPAGSYAALHIRRAARGDVWLVSDLVRSAGPGTPGSALPAAIGLQLGQPERQVWVIERAQSFEMSIQELATVAQEQLPIKMIILGNDSLGQEGRQQPVPQDGQGLGPGPLLPDLARIAGAYGIQGLAAQDAGELTRVIEKVSAVPGPSLIDARAVRDLPDGSRPGT